MTPPAISIVVPTYNERHRLRELLDATFGALQKAGIDGEVIVVDDNSPDGTGRHAEELRAGRRLRVVHRPGKLGLGTAVIEGFAASEAAVFGVMDADLSHPPALVPVLLRLLQTSDADMVVASRYITGGGTENWPLTRLLMSRLACWFARPLTPVRDGTSGFFLIRRDRVRDVRISAGGFKICLELLVRTAPRSVAEVPYLFVGRRAGESKMNVQEALGYLRQVVDLLRYRRAHRRETPPVIYRRLSPAAVASLAASGPAGDES